MSHSLNGRIGPVAARFSTKRSLLATSPITTPCRIRGRAPIRTRVDSHNCLQQRLFQHQQAFPSTSHRINSDTTNVQYAMALDDSDDEDTTIDQPWKYLLELPARASWRVSDPRPPEAVVTAQQSILTAGRQAGKQLDRCHQAVIASHQALAQLRERERRRLVNNTPYQQRQKLRDESVAPVCYGPGETLANLRRRLEPNYAIAKRVLEECQSLLGRGKHYDQHWQPRRVIDMGIGCGSASAAALEVFPTLEWIHGIDPSQCMRECAKELLEDTIAATTATANRSTTESNTNSNNTQQQPRIVTPTRVTLSGSISTDASATTFDLALFSYTATELPHVTSTLAAAAILWEKLDNNGVFVMIEPGTPDGFNSCRAVRNMLLDCCPPNPTDDNDDDDEEYPRPRDQCHIIAPCTHNGKCPMERHQHDFFKQKVTPADIDFTNEGGDDENDEALDEMWEPEEDDDDNTDVIIDTDEENGEHFKVALVEETEFLNTRFCSFVQTLSTATHFNSKGEKFSYLVAHKRIPAEDMKDVSVSAVSPQQSTLQDDRITELMGKVYQLYEQTQGTPRGETTTQQQQKAIDLFQEAMAMETRYLDSDEDPLGLELLQGDGRRNSFGRIIRAPIKKPGHVYVDYCAAPGTLRRTRITKAMGTNIAPGLFTAARKARWGGLWPDVATEKK